MSKRRDRAEPQLPPRVPSEPPERQARLSAVARRFDREYRGEDFEVPDEVAALPIYRERATGALQARIASPFWELAKPTKGQHCLDLGCGASFLIYPWREWNAFFHGRDLSRVACEMLNSRGPQLNSKLFKGATVGPAHRLTDAGGPFDLAIATGVSCYFPPDYWGEVLQAVRGVLKPGGTFAFDVLDPEASLAENWAILETYLGAEVELEPLATWEAQVKAAGGRILSRREGDPFCLYKVKF